MAPKKLTPNQKKAKVVRLLVALREKGHTIQMLASAVGVSHDSIWRWTTNENSFPASTRVDDVLKAVEAFKG